MLEAHSLLQSLALSLIAGGLILVVIQLTLGQVPRPGSVVATLVGATVIFLVKANKLRLAARVMCWGLTLAALIGIYLFQGPNSPAWIAMPIAVMTSGWFLGRRDAILMVAVQMIGFAAIAGLNASGHEFSPPWHPMSGTVVIAMGILASAWVAMATADTFRRQINQLSEARQHLAAIVDSTEDLIWSVDCKDFRILWFNSGLSEHLRKQYGLDVETGMRTEDLPLPLLFRQTWNGYFKRALESGPFSTEYVDATGTIFLYVGFHLIRQDGEVIAISVFGKNITALKRAEEEIKTLAFYDPLTRLPNRRLLLDRLGLSLVSSKRSNKHGALLFIDLDNFKILNDTLGHDIGDLLLQQVAQRLTACVRKGDTAVRLGGDEFVVVLEDLSENAIEAATQSEYVGKKILEALDQAYFLDRHTHRSTASIGVTLFAGCRESIDELLKRADLAMYQAKNAGRNTIRFFDPEMQVVVKARMDLETDLRDAITNSQFLLHYQAQVVGEGRVTGAEVLLRWQHPERGIVSPADFIPLAEESGLILPLGHWVLQTVCAQLSAWAAQPDMAHLTASVNISARQFRMPNFVEEVRAILDHHGVNPRRLKLELTESILVDNVEDLIGKMNALKASGVGFSLDDFGTGYSSLAYLKRLPLDQLKIDQSFVRDILTDPNDVAIAKMVIVLAESLGLEVIAEGVEEQAQKECLARHGCHAYQGYLFGRPLPVKEFEATMRS